MVANSSATKNFRTFTLPILIVIYLFIANTALGNEPVTGSYLSAGGTNITLKVVVNSAKPINLIVEQFFPAGTKIISTSPPVKKISSGGRKVKWLIRKQKKSVIKLQTKLSQPLQGQVSSVIRYRPPQGGNLIEVRITP